MRQRIKKRYDQTARVLTELYDNVLSYHQVQRMYTKSLVDMPLYRETFPLDKDMTAVKMTRTNIELEISRMNIN